MGSTIITRPSRLSVPDATVRPHQVQFRDVMRTSIACGLIALSGCMTPSHSLDVLPQLTPAQHALLALLASRGDVARGETAVDRCTTTLRAGSGVIPAISAIPGARLSGHEPAAGDCPAFIRGVEAQNVLVIDSIHPALPAGSPDGPMLAVVVTTITPSASVRHHERYVIAPSARNAMHSPWRVLDYRFLGSDFGDQSGRPPDK